MSDSEGGNSMLNRNVTVDIVNKRWDNDVILGLYDISNNICWT
jgi:hypothetical protein